MEPGFNPSIELMSALMPWMDYVFGFEVRIFWMTLAFYGCVIWQLNPNATMEHKMEYLTILSFLFDFYMK
jgi:hypothetical protein